MTNFPLRHFLFLLFALSLQKTVAQSCPLPIGSPTTEMVDRMQILTGQNAPVQTDVRPFLRKNAVQLATVFDTTAHQFLLAAELRDIQFIRNDNNEHLAAIELPNTLLGKNQRQLIENQQLATPPLASKFSVFRKIRQKPLLKYFYQTPANFFEVNSKYFRLRANPIINFELGKTGSDDPQTVFMNRRGIEVRGDVDDRIFFTTNLVETQAGLPGFADARFAREHILPGSNLVKPYDSRIFNVKNGYDFNQSDARIGFHATHHIGVEFGRATHFIGNGYRSLLLSDFAAPFLYLKFNTKVWRLHYQNLFAELVPEILDGDQLLPKKYLAAHYLSLNLTKNWTVGLFEAVVLHRTNHFELNYLNPVIFYRTVEGGIGSPDNALLGLNSRLNIARRGQIYGQILLDEFNFKYAVLPKKGEKGWWANKFGGQIGAKYLNALGIDHLDLQAELNLVRPYTYAHDDSVNTSYANYGIPLAHPLTANFREVMLRAKWAPAGRFSFESKVFLIKNGDDPVGQNFGNNVQLNYRVIPNEFGNFIGQGIGSDILLCNFDMNFALFHNGFLDFRAGYRRKKSDEASLSRSEFWFGTGFRMNIGAWKSEF